MSQPLSRRAILGSLALGALGAPWAAAAPRPAASDARLQAVLDYARSQKTTGFLVIQDRRVLAQAHWPAPADDASFRLFTYETTPQGELLEDVASQQKSLVSMLVAVAIGRGLLDPSQAVSERIGAGWSKAAPGEEARIRLGSGHGLHLPGPARHGLPVQHAGLCRDQAGLDGRRGPTA